MQLQTPIFATNVFSHTYKLPGVYTDFPKMKRSPAPPFLCIGFAAICAWREAKNHRARLGIAVFQPVVIEGA
jgi:hypothetical protein